jgi:hypothetical protein
MPGVSEVMFSFTEMLFAAPLGNDQFAALLPNTKQTYRGKHKNYGLVWNVVARLVNFKKSTLI